jgi:hypothetical protein
VLYIPTLADRELVRSTREKRETLRPELLLFSFNRLVNRALGGVSAASAGSLKGVLEGEGAPMLIEVSETLQFCDRTTLKSLIVCKDVDLLQDFFLSFFSKFSSNVLSAPVKERWITRPPFGYNFIPGEASLSEHTEDLLLRLRASRLQSKERR